MSTYPAGRIDQEAAQPDLLFLVDVDQITFFEVRPNWLIREGVIEYTVNTTPPREVVTPMRRVYDLMRDISADEYKALSQKGGGTE